MLISLTKYGVYVCVVREIGGNYKPLQGHFDSRTGQLPRDVPHTQTFASEVINMETRSRFAQPESKEPAILMVVFVVQNKKIQFIETTFFLLSFFIVLCIFWKCVILDI